MGVLADDDDDDAVVIVVLDVASAVLPRPSVVIADFDVNPALPVFSFSSVVFASTLVPVSFGTCKDDDNGDILGTRDDDDDEVFAFLLGTVIAASASLRFDNVGLGVSVAVAEIAVGMVEEEECDESGC